MTSPLTIFTIGHRNTSLEHFLSLLKAHNIAVLVDTRTYPASRYAPHFNQRSLDQSLNEAGIEYRYLGDKLGGRPRSSELYGPDGKVDYDRIEASAAYQEGIAQLLETPRRGGSRTALQHHGWVCILCSEEDPLRCHRRNLIARTLVRRGVSVQHIRGDGRLEGEEAARERELHMALGKKQNGAQARLL